MISTLQVINSTCTVQTDKLLKLLNNKLLFKISRDSSCFRERFFAVVVFDTNKQPERVGPCQILQQKIFTPELYFSGYEKEGV